MAGSSGIWTPGGEHPVGEPREPEGARERQPELSPEELMEVMRKLKVSDFLLSSLSTLAQLAYGKLDPASRDLPEARLAIDALRALVTVLEGTAPPDAIRDLGQVTANLQLAYATAADEAAQREDAGA